MSYDYAGYRRRQYNFPQATQPFRPYQPVQPRRVTCWDPPSSRVEVLRPPSWPDPESPYVSHHLDPPDPSRRLSAMTRRGDGQSGLSLRDNPEGSNPPRAFPGSSEIFSAGLEKIMARFDKLESRLESRCEEIDRRVKNLHASKAAYRRQSYADFDSGAPRRRPTGWDPPFETSSHRVGETRAPPLPEPPLYRSWQPSCWEPPPHRASQGYSDYDQPPPCLPSCWDTPRRQTDHFRQQRSPRPSTQPWHPEIMGFEEKMEEFDQVSEKTEEYDQESVKTEDFEQESNFSSPFYFKLLNPSFSVNQESSSEMEKIVSLEGVCGEKEEEDFRAEGKMVDEEFCYEIELIPGSHSSSLDRESDAHQEMEKNDSSNWMGSFLDEADESKSSLLDDDNHENKATFDEEEFIEMEPQSVKLRLKSKDLGKKGDGSYTSLPLMACVYMDLNVGDVTSMIHRPTSLDTDARLIPPRNNKPCLRIQGCVAELSILALNLDDHISPPLLIFYGGDEEGRSAVRCVFDPGGAVSPKSAFNSLYCFVVPTLRTR